MPEKASRRRPLHFWTWSHRLTAAAFLVLLVLSHQDWFPWFKGSPTGTRLLDVVPFVDVLAAAEAALASRQVTTTMLVGAGLVLAVAVLLGRVFCGWLCPLGLVLELSSALSSSWGAKQKTRRLGLPPGGAKGLKYWLLLACLVMSFVAAFPVFTTLSPINLTVLAFVSALGWELAVVGGIVAAELFSPRLFCRAICPLGAAYSLLGRFGLLRIHIRPECGERLYCHLCTNECPMGIEVLERHVKPGKQTVDDPECTRCGICADGCLGEMLQLSLRTKEQNRTTVPGD